MKFLSWNVRELNNPFKDAVIRNIIQSQSISVVVLTETKLQQVNCNKVASLCGYRNFQYLSSTPIYSRGGVLLLWDPEVSN